MTQYSNRFILCGLVLVCLISCVNEKPQFSSKQLQSQDSLFKEIMVIHDEVMPLTSTLVQRRDILEKSDKTDSISESLIKELETAEEAMWDWMYAIKRPEQIRDTFTHEQIIDYLDQEFKTISKVKNLMLNAAENSNQISDNE